MGIFENIDCMIGMEKYKDILTSRKVLAICDPPYGIGIDGQKYSKRQNGTQLRKHHDFKGWDNNTPNHEYFNLLMSMTNDQIIWGGNYFTEYLRPTKAWVFWYKGQNDLTMSDGEMAWTSLPKVTRQINIHRTHLWQENPQHPTQKPIALYKWLLENYAKDHDLILDTHVGSASSLIACEEYGIDYMGFELDSDYYTAAKQRIEKARFERENKFADECYTKDLALFGGLQ